MQPAARSLQDTLRDLDEVEALLNGLRAERKTSMPCSKEEFARRIAISYENTVSFLKDYPVFLTLVNEEGDTPLHTTVSAVELDPKARAHSLTFACVLLELGMRNDLPNHRNQTAIDLALESNDPLLVEIYTAEKPCKKTLIELAEKHNEYNIVEWLSRKADIESHPPEARRMKVEEQMVEWHNRARLELARKDEPALHTAIHAFIEGDQESIRDIFELMQLPGALHDKKAVELARENQFLTRLFTLESPTKDDVVALACEMDLPVVIESMLGD